MRRSANWLELKQSAMLNTAISGNSEPSPKEIRNLTESGIQIHQDASLRWLTFEPLRRLSNVVHGIIIRSNGDVTDNYTRQHFQSQIKRLGIPHRHLFLPRQVHGNKVVVFSEGEDQKNNEVVFRADAMVTNQPGWILGVQTADCLPIFLVDETGKRIGLIHAGWRSLLLGIVGRAVKAMLLYSGGDAEHIVALIGPGLEARCFEVDSEIALLFPGSVRGPNQAGKYQVDLQAQAVRQLKTAGIEKRNIYQSVLCTRCCPTWFHSYRRDNEKAGRMLAFIGLRF